MAFRELAELRKRFLLSQDRAAEIFGVSSGLIVSHWETGFRRPSETLRRLVLALNKLPKSKAEEILLLLDAPTIERRRRLP